jgi:ribonuclease-3
MFVDDLESVDINLKNKLIGWASKNGKTLSFELVDEKREGNRRLFQMDVLIDGETIASGKGYNKKDASQQAAQTALLKLGI